MESMGGLRGKSGNANRQVGQMIRRIFSQENHLRLARKRLNVGGVGQASGAHVTLDDFGKILFEEGHVAPVPFRPCANYRDGSR